MPRQARQKSESGFYHILLRGIGQQNIFEDEEDNERFLKTLKRYRDEMQFEIHAYCLMGNHVHLLIKDIKNELDLIIKKLAGSYAYYFNWKYERTGHLFQDRFKSEVVNDDSYYLALIQYIHQNPQKANIALAQEYKWSSYREYLGCEEIIKTDFALELLGGREQFSAYVQAYNDDSFLDIYTKENLTDRKAIDIIKKKYKIDNAISISTMPAEQRDKLIDKLKNEGMSIRQISRLTGVNRGVVLRV